MTTPGFSEDDLTLHRGVGLAEFQRNRRPEELHNCDDETRDEDEQDDVLGGSHR